MARGGGPAFTYTHATRTVERAAWGRVSVLGSIDRMDQVEQVLDQGYAPARYVSSFPNGKSSWKEQGIRWIPCPSQTHDNITCQDCRLCFDADALRKRAAGIAFAAHGNKAKAIKRRLEVVQ
jgi:ribulose bisphosphate carboxylase small subunit